MSNLLEPQFGLICRVWPLAILDGRSFHWVEEEAGRVHFAVLHMYDQGLWYAVEGYVLRNPNPYPAEVEPLRGRLLRVGYPVFRRDVTFLAIEESDGCRWWLIYSVVNGDYLLAREFQSSVSDDTDESSDSDDSLGDDDVSEALGA